MKAYTINQIQAEVTATGSHWFDPGTLRYFKCRVSEQVYQGPGGIYFVTSERYDNDPRKYTVRKFDPETKDISTMGEFNTLTRHQAHARAAELAGEGAIVAAEVHKPRSNAEQFIMDMKAHNGVDVEMSQYAKLRNLERYHHKMMEDYCNGVDMYDEEGEPLPHLTKLRNEIYAIAGKMGCVGVQFSGDPRGATVKLQLKDGATNDWGNEGWVIPD